MRASVSETQENLQIERMNWRGILNFLQKLTPKCARVFSTLESSLSCRRRSVRKIAWLNSRRIKSQKRISINTLIFPRSSVGKRVSRLTYVLVQAFLRSLCCRSKKVEMVESVDDPQDVAVNWRAQIPEF